MLLRSGLFVLAWGLVASLGGDARAAPPPDLPLPVWEQLAVEAAPWLLGSEQKQQLATLPPAARGQALRALLADPDPATAENELLEGVRRRRALMLSESLTTVDKRARLLFLQGPPDERQRVDCSAVFVPLEIWRYGALRLVLYQGSAAGPFHLWLPIDGKRALYTHEMGGWLEEWESLAGRI
ncbi:MAG TPA: hypothetical protein VGV61_12870, partial [Thermoanaerobaculia bacterium]|nr:hypothetical protein [Thermoanaerobaculia bacterium]